MRLNTQKGCQKAAAQLLGLAILIAVLCISPANAATTHLFDAELSLVGNCTVSERDPVEDPSCPYAPFPDGPTAGFENIGRTTADPSGDIYVASNNPNGGANTGKKGRIDIFSPEGQFITELKDEFGPRNIAVDSEGYLYVFRSLPLQSELVRYKPTVYNPASEEIEYGAAPVVVIPTILGAFTGLQINPLNDHLFVFRGPRIQEYSAGKEGNALINGTIGESDLQESLGLGMAIDASRDRIYVSDREKPQGGPYLIRIFELSSPYDELGTIKASAIPSGVFPSEPALAVEEATGNLYLYMEVGGSGVVHQLTESGQHVSEITRFLSPTFGGELGFDNSPSSPNQGYLYVPSVGISNTNHSFAFAPTDICVPEISEVSVANTTSAQTELRGTVNPCNANTDFTFEYTTLEKYEAGGFEGAEIADTGSLPAIKSPLPVYAAASGLSPETDYRFRIVAVNEVGNAEAEGGFSTYPSSTPPSICANDAFRIGPSTRLPDCRAYELVSPPETNARTPRAFGFAGSPQFGGPQAAPIGNSVSFMTEGGLIPGTEGTGWLSGDPYLATRAPEGWVTSSSGATGAEASAAAPGSTSPDQGFSFWTAQGEGSALVDGKNTTYVRYPDGHSELIGRGSLGVDPRAAGKLISENGGHIVFVTGADGAAVQLEPDAPPAGTGAIYDRTSDEQTHLVSLFPGDITPSPGQKASYVGASLDGLGVAFTIDGTLYLRFDNDETYAVGSSSLVFAGIAEGGKRIFYLEGGDLKAFDIEEGVIPFSTSGDVTPVNVSADGSTAYFVSPASLTADPNPNGAIAKTGANNLYSSREGAVDFVGTVTKRDVEGEPGLVDQVGGLGLWTQILDSGRPGAYASDPSRTTPDGSVLLFESRSNLAGYEPEGHAQVYRFDGEAEELECLSCLPTKAKAEGEASLQTPLPAPGDPAPTVIFSLVPNIRADGRRAFFESTEPLVPEDTDGRKDVYEWEAMGVGTCNRPTGCVYLISSGRSDQDEYLYSVSASGNDVFFSSADLLLARDRETTYSIYDARVGGGFPEPAVEEECQGEGCRSTISPPPSIAAPGEPALGADDNLNLPRRCPKGKRKVKRHGEVHCVKKKHAHRKGADRHRRGGSAEGGNRK